MSRPRGCFIVHTSISPGHGDLAENAGKRDRSSKALKFASAALLCFRLPSPGSCVAPLPELRICVVSISSAGFLKDTCNWGTISARLHITQASAATRKLGKLPSKQLELGGWWITSTRVIPGVSGPAMRHRRARDSPGHGHHSGNDPQ